MELAKLVRSCVPKVQDWKGERASVLEVKLDGYSAVLSHEKDGSFAAVGRKAWNTNLWHQLDIFHDHIADTLRDTPPGTVALGELWVPGHPATAVPTALNGGLPLRFSAFALPMFDGRNYMLEPLDAARAGLKQLGFQVVEQLEFPQTSVLADLAICRSYLEDLSKARGIEGVVLKNGHFTEWYRCKPVLTADVIVVGWQEHKKQPGVVGSFEVAAYRNGKLEVLGSVGSGWGAAERKALSYEERRGQVMEVQYEKVGAQGGLIFPRFSRWRDDKLPDECRAPEWEDLGGGPDDHSAA